MNSINFDLTIDYIFQVAITHKDDYVKLKNSLYSNSFESNLIIANNYTQMVIRQIFPSFIFLIFSIKYNFTLFVRGKGGKSTLYCLSSILKNKGEIQKKSLSKLCIKKIILKFYFFTSNRLGWLEMN